MGLLDKFKIKKQDDRKNIKNENVKTDDKSSSFTDKQIEFTLLLLNDNFEGYVNWGTGDGLIPAISVTLCAIPKSKEISIFVYNNNSTRDRLLYDPTIQRKFQLGEFSLLEDGQPQHRSAYILFSDPNNFEKFATSNNPILNKTKYVWIEEYPIGPKSPRTLGKKEYTIEENLKRATKDKVIIKRITASSW